MVGRLGWKFSLALGAGLALGFLIAPAAGWPPGVRVLLVALVDALGAAGVLAGIRLYRPPAPTPWLLLAASQLCWFAADVVAYVKGLVEHAGSAPWSADALYLARFPLVIAALLMFVRRRTPGWDRAGLLDAAIVAVPVSLLAWMYVIGPAADHEHAVGNWAVAESYPILDLVVLVLGVRLLFGAGPRTTAFRLLLATVLAWLVGGVLYCVALLHGHYAPGGLHDLVWLAASVLIGAAGLHPSMRRLDERSPVAVPEVTFGRLALLAIASVVPPVAQLVQYLRGEPLHVPLVSGGCVVLFLLVVARLAGLIVSQRHLAITDGLTGLRTRPFFEQAIITEVERAFRTQLPLGLLLLDVDHFKRVNDVHGHQAGDRVLCEVARRLAGAVRGSDLVARFDGQQFAVLLTAVDPEGLLRVAERVRLRVSDSPVAGGAAAEPVTVSIGAALLPGLVSTADELIREAERALTAAKVGGRNQVRPPTVAALNPRGVIDVLAGDRSGIPVG
jgi:diguanylate cyclase (GGDEF)-like protein